jgi:predicted patatin/cPLA2 family phospholipase
MTMTPVALSGIRPEAAIANIRRRFGKDSSNAGDGRKLGLIVEGGAMRGIFSCGGGIALELLGLSRAFDEVYACSSGAINAAYFVAGQAAYSVSIYYDEVNNRKFINPLRLNNILDMDFLFNEVIKRRKPLDVARVLSSPSKLRISITDANTGAGFLIDAQDSRYALLDSLRASATHPLLSERTRRLGDRECFDGGFANPLPVKDAIDNGCTDLLVLSTRPSDYIDPRPGFVLRMLFTWLCARGNAALLEAAEDIHVRENRSRDLALGRRAGPPGVNILTICPGAATRLSRTMKNRELLKAAAAEGARQVFRAFDADPGRLAEVMR